MLRSSNAKIAVLAASVALLLAAMAASVLFGLQQFGVRELLQAYRSFDGSNEHLILTTVRVPRALIAAAVGACLAIAGVLMQALTRNPLASPSLFGINAGAVLFIVIGIVVSGASLTMSGMIWIAFIGAALTALLIYALSLYGGFDPVRLSLGGAAVAAFASSITSGVMLIHKQSLETALFWMIGSVSGRRLEHLLAVLPYMAVGWVIALLLAASLNVLVLGEDNAKSLGQRLSLVRFFSLIAVVLLAGSAVAAAGPIAFIGLVVPHVCRGLVGTDHRWLVPYCAAFGALLLVSADLASRFVLMPKEVPVGVATALIGVPFLIHVARRRRHG